MMSKKLHHIRPLKGKQKKIHVKAECDSCGRSDVVSIYEDQVEHQDFKVSFYECPQCKHTFCSICVGDVGKIECPFCKRLKPKKIKPFDIYVCGVCFDEFWNKGGLCNECKYVRAGSPKKDGHYEGPPED
jgi:hypothetical protein